MTYDAGRARGVYELDIRPFERGVQTALSRYATLEQAARRALQARPILPAPALGPIRPTTDTGDAAASRAAQIRAIEQALARQATAERAALRQIYRTTKTNHYQQKSPRKQRSYLAHRN